MYFTLLSLLYQEVSRPCVSQPMNYVMGFHNTNTVRREDTKHKLFLIYYQSTNRPLTKDVASIILSLDVWLGLLKFFVIKYFKITQNLLLNRFSLTFILETSIKLYRHIPVLVKIGQRTLTWDLLDDFQWTFRI